MIAKITDNGITIEREVTTKFISTINEEIFSQEKCDYVLKDRDDLVDDLIMWIAESHNSDKAIMLQDLKYILKLSDKYVFSSILTNEYIAYSDNQERFDEICRELLTLNEEFDK